METKKFERKSGKYVGMIAFVLVLISVLSLIFSISPLAFAHTSSEAFGQSCFQVYCLA